MKNNKNNGFVRNSFIYILLIIAGITAFQYYLRGTSTQSQQINYSTLIKQIKAGDIKSITYQPRGRLAMGVENADRGTCTGAGNRAKGQPQDPKALRNPR